jgi:periplasmic protein TonB
MAVNTDIYDERESWRGPLAWSTAFHAFLLASIFLYAAILGSEHAENWGGSGGGGAISATLVSNASIPLPTPEVETKNIVANESKGVSQSLPTQVEKPTPEAIAIPDKNTKTKPSPSNTTSANTKPKPVTPSNVVPFGQGGPISGPYGVFSVNGAKGGFSMTGGGGDFGNRFGWYVDAVRRKVSDNWMKYEIDPSISSARRVYITFDILRDGTPTNVQLEQSSGVPSLDQSAVRALQRIDTFGALPPGYSGNKVSVEFWFDYRR